MTLCKTDSGERRIDRELGSGLRDGPGCRIGRELGSGLRDGPGQDGGGREAPEGGDICAHMFDPRCCMAETNTTL